MKKITILALILLTCISCKSIQSRLDKAEAEINHAENNKKEMTSNDWKDLETLMADLDKDLESNRGDYTSEQINLSGRLQGRYKILLVKKGLNDFTESFKDVGSQIEGVMDAISDTNK